MGSRVGPQQLQEREERGYYKCIFIQETGRSRWLFNSIDRKKANKNNKKKNEREREKEIGRNKRPIRSFHAKSDSPLNILKSLFDFSSLFIFPHFFIFFLLLLLLLLDSICRPMSFCFLYLIWFCFLFCFLFWIYFIIFIELFLGFCVDNSYIYRRLWYQKWMAEPRFQAVASSVNAGPIRAVKERHLFYSCYTQFVSSFILFFCWSLVPRPLPPDWPRPYNPPPQNHHVRYE